MNRKGFTLVELLVVIALITLITTFALPELANFFKVSLNSITLQLASTVKEAYNSTVVTGKVHRVAYDLSENRFWVESGPKNALLDSEKSRELEEERRSSFREEKKKPPAFALDPTITAKKIELPTGVRFVEVLTEQSTEPLTEGVTYTHFFPQGITEQTIIHLEDSQEHQTSLVISPLVGRTQVFPGHVTQEEILGR